MNKQNNLNYAGLIGIPYERIDCWGIALEFYKRVFNIELKRYYDEVPNNRDIAKNLIYHNKGDFIEVSEPEFGDIILIKLYGVESHIAIYIGGGKILHSYKNVGCHIDNIKKWNKLIVGYYRVMDK